MDEIKNLSLLKIDTKKRRNFHFRLRNTHFDGIHRGSKWNAIQQNNEIESTYSRLSSECPSDVLFMRLLDQAIVDAWDEK